MKTFHLTIARVGETVFDGSAASATLPGADGVFEVLPEHEALVSELKAGEIVVKTEAGATERFAIPAGGMAEVSHNQATVLL